MKIAKKLLSGGRRLVLKIPRLKSGAPQPLVLKDFSGYDQPYHPSVLYFHNSLFGYKYWMVQTPFPVNGKPYRGRWECPCVYWSNDGWDWKTSKKANPIDDLDGSEIANGDYFSDPHLVYRDDTKKLECWYRITHMDRTKENRTLQYPTYLVRKTTKDGVNWSDRELLIDFQSDTSLDIMVRSPSIIWDSNRKVYRMWYVDTLPTLTNRNIRYSESSDGVNWGSKITIVLDNYIDPWHIDVNYFDDTYHLINYTLTGSKGLHYYQSNDGIHFYYEKELLKPSLFRWNSFYRAGLYRSCSLKTHDEVRVYFSANDGISTFIGVMKGDNFDNMKVVDVSNAR